MKKIKQDMLSFRFVSLTNSEGFCRGFYMCYSFALRRSSAPLLQLEFIFSFFFNFNELQFIFTIGWKMKLLNSRIK